MAELAIEVRDLEKSYPILPDRKSWLRLLLGPARGLPRHTALQQVSFRVPRGTALGIVGDNGAGKSTLLKILCGASQATVGTASVRGQVGALLELGTGLHPEFSGRENIRFSAALLGLTRERARDLEPGIIAFSELGDLIDAPLKTYSTGMSLRLAFAVATGFSPEVLVIDEALSVGDQVFQKKCTDRIQQFRKEGATIVFCSHNLTQVQSLCEQALWLEKGQVAASGPANTVVNRYRDVCRARMNNSGSEASSEAAGPAKDGVTIERIELSGPQQRRDRVFHPGDSLRLDVWARFPERQSQDAGIGIALVRNDGVLVYATTTNLDGHVLSRQAPGLFHAALCLSDIQVLSGRYSFNVFTSDAGSLQTYDHRDGVEPFTVSGSTLERGIVRLQHHWE